MRFAEKVAIVTGAGSGIGRAAALRLASEGASVICAGRTAAKVEETARLIADAHGHATPLQIDVASEGASTRTVAFTLDRYSRLDILVNNAAVGRSQENVSPGSMRPLTKTAENQFREVVEIDLNAVAFMMRAAIPSLIDSGKGAIVNVASVFGFRGSPLDHAYSAAKAGIINLTRSVAITYGKNNLRANCVAPGLVDTAMAADIIATGFLQDPKTRFQASALGRAAQPEELAATIAFLASDDASFVTGTTLVVDGGLTARAF